MENFKSKLERVIDKTFEILRTGNSESRLIFPTYRNKERRVSEQELRFVFVEQLQDLLKEYNFYYSVETPTKDKYKFTENRKKIKPHRSKEGKSANFDLSIIDKDGAIIALIEFKAKMASEHEYAKDFCKLCNPTEKSVYKYFINVFEKIEAGTKNSFLNKLNRWLPDKNKEKSSEEVVVIAQSLRKDDSTIKETI